MAAPGKPAGAPRPERKIGAVQRPGITEKAHAALTFGEVHAERKKLNADLAGLKKNHPKEVSLLVRSWYLGPKHAGRREAMLEKIRGIIPCLARVDTLHKFATGELSLSKPEERSQLEASLRAIKPAVEAEVQSAIRFRNIKNPNQDTLNSLAIGAALKIELAVLKKQVDDLNKI